MFRITRQVPTCTTNFDPPPKKNHISTSFANMEWTYPPPTLYIRYSVRNFIRAYSNILWNNEGCGDLSPHPTPGRCNGTPPNYGDGNGNNRVRRSSSFVQQRCRLTLIDLYSTESIQSINHLELEFQNGEDTTNQGETDITSDKESTTIVTSSTAVEKITPTRELDSVQNVISSEKILSFPALTGRWLPLEEIKVSVTNPYDFQLAYYRIPEFLQGLEKKTINFALFRNFLYGRFALRFRFVVNSNKFNVGKVIVSAKYHSYQTTGIFSSCKAALCRPHIILDLATSNTGEIEVPFRYGRPAVRLHITDKSTSAVRPREFAALIMSVLSPLVSEAGQPTTVDIRPMVMFTQADMMGMTFETQFTVLEGLELGFQGGASILSFLNGNPLPAIRFACSLVEKGITQFGKLYNTDKPSDYRVTRVVPQPRMNFASGKGLTDPVALRVNPTATTSFLGIHVPEDEPKSFYELSRIWGLYGNVAWSKESAAETTLATIVVDPTLRHTADKDKSFFGDTPTPLEFACGHYAFWSGPIEFRLDFVSNQFHSGSLMLTAEFGQEASADIYGSSSTYTKIFHLGEQKTVTFTVPYIYDTYARRTTSGFGNIYGDLVPDNTIRKKALLVAPLPHTTFNIRVVNALRPMASTTSTIDILVFMRAGENFTLYGLKPASFVYPWFTPVMDNFPEDNYTSLSDGKRNQWQELHEETYKESYALSDSTQKKRIAEIKKDERNLRKIPEVKWLRSSYASYRVKTLNQVSRDKSLKLLWNEFADARKKAQAEADKKKDQKLTPRGPIDEETDSDSEDLIMKVTTPRPIETQSRSTVMRKWLSTPLPTQSTTTVSTSRPTLLPPPKLIIPFKNTPGGRVGKQLSVDPYNPISNASPDGRYKWFSSSVGFVYDSQTNKWVSDEWWLTNDFRYMFTPKLPFQILDRQYNLWVPFEFEKEVQMMQSDAADESADFSQGQIAYPHMTSDFQTSFVDILRRPTLIVNDMVILSCRRLTKSDDVSVGQIGFFIPVMPPTRQMGMVSPSLGNSIWSKSIGFSPAASIVSMFRLWRGDTRYTIVVKNAKQVVYVFYIPHSGVRILGNHSINPKAPFKQFPLFGMGYHVEMIIPTVNPTATIEVPYESENTWTVAWDNDTNANYTWRDKGDLNSGHVVIWTAESGVSVDVFWHAGDNFRVADFYGVPLCKNNDYAYRYNETAQPRSLIPTKLEPQMELMEFTREAIEDANMPEVLTMMRKVIIESIPALGIRFICAYLPFGDIFANTFTTVYTYNRVLAAIGPIMNKGQEVLQRADVGIMQVSRKALNVATHAEETLTTLSEQITGKATDVTSTLTAMVRSYLLSMVNAGKLAVDMLELVFDFFVDLISAWIVNNVFMVGVAIFRAILKFAGKQIYGSLVTEFATKLSTCFTPEPQGNMSKLIETPQIVSLIVAFVGTIFGVALDTKRKSGIIMGTFERLTTTTGIMYFAGMLRVGMLVFDLVRELVCEALGVVSNEAQVLNKLSEASEPIKNFVVEAQQLLSEVNKTAFKMPHFRHRFWTTYMQALQIQKLLVQIPNNKVSPVLHRLCSEVVKFCNENWEAISASPVRHEPYVIFIEGEPGIGKSHSTEILVEKMMKAVGFSQPGAGSIYWRTPGEKFWSGYHDQFAICYDEWFNLNDQESCIALVKELFKIKGPALFIAEQAEISMKENHCNPFVVIFNCNKAFVPDLSNYSRTPEAVMRRRDCVLKYTIKKEYLEARREGRLDETDITEQCEHLEVQHYKDPRDPKSIEPGSVPFNLASDWVAAQFAVYFGKEKKKVKTRLDRFNRLVYGADIKDIKIEDPFSLYYKQGKQHGLVHADLDWTPFSDLQSAMEQLADVIDAHNDIKDLTRDRVPEWNNLAEWSEAPEFNVDPMDPPPEIEESLEEYARLVSKISPSNPSPLIERRSVSPIMEEDIEPQFGDDPTIEPNVSPDVEGFANGRYGVGPITNDRQLRRSEKMYCAEHNNLTRYGVMCKQGHFFCLHGCMETIMYAPFEWPNCCRCSVETLDKSLYLVNPSMIMRNAYQKKKFPTTLSYVHYLYEGALIGKFDYEGPYYVTSVRSIMTWYYIACLSLVYIEPPLVVPRVVFQCQQLVDDLYNTSVDMIECVHHRMRNGLYSFADGYFWFMTGTTYEKIPYQCYRCKLSDREWREFWDDVVIQSKESLERLRRAGKPLPTEVFDNRLVLFKRVTPETWWETCTAFTREHRKLMALSAVAVTVCGALYGLTKFIKHPEAQRYEPDRPVHGKGIKRGTAVRPWKVVKQGLEQIELDSVPSLEEVVERRVRENAINLFCKDDNGKACKIFGIGIVNHWVMVPRHSGRVLQNCLNRREEVIMEPFYQRHLRKRIAHNKIIFVQGYDLAFVQMPSSTRMFKDISKFFATDDDINCVPKDVSLLAPPMGNSDMMEKILVKIERFEYNSSVKDYDGEVLTNSEALMYNYSRKGLCGALVMIPNSQRPLVGMHYAGTSGLYGFAGSGFAVVVTRELILHYLDVANVAVDTENIEVQSVDLAKLVIEDPEVQIGYVGSVPPKLQPHIPSKSKLEPSLLYGVEGLETIKEPAILSEKDPRYLHTTTPLYEGVRKHGLLTDDFPSEIIDQAGELLFDGWIGQMKPLIVDPKKLTLKQAIIGLPSPDYPGMELSTSAGYPWCLKYKNKQELIEVEPIDSGNKLTWKVKVDKTLINRVEESVDMLKEGVVPGHIFIDTLKDEKRNKEKLMKLGGTRVFCNSPVDSVILLRMYCMHFIAAFMKNRRKMMHAVGINPTSAEWGLYYRDLKQHGEYFCTIDYANFGAAFNACVCQKAYDLIRRWIKLWIPGVTCRELDALFKTVVQSQHIVLNTVYYQLCGSPSGAATTTIINSLVNQMYVLIAWLEIVGPLLTAEFVLQEFKENVVLFVYGDDLIMSVSEKWIKVFNTLTISQYFAKYKIVATGADKTAEITPTTHWSESTFLKRGFTEHPYRPGEMLSPLDLESIKSTTQWVWKGPCLRESTRINCEAALLQAHGHGKHFFEKLKQKINFHLQQRDIETIAITWKEIDEKFFSEGLPEFGYGYKKERLTPFPAEKPLVGQINSSDDTVGVLRR